MKNKKYNTLKLRTRTKVLIPLLIAFLLISTFVIPADITYKYGTDGSGVSWFGPVNAITNSNDKCWELTAGNLQNASNDLNSTDSGTVWMGGDITTTVPIYLNDNVTLDLCGYTLSMQAGTNKNLIENYDNSTLSSYIKVINGILDGVDSTLNANKRGIVLVNVSKCTILDVSLYNVYWGIALSEGSVSASNERNEIRDCKVDNCNSGIVIDGNNNTIAHCDVYNCTGYAFYARKSNVGNNIWMDIRGYGAKSGSATGVGLGIAEYESPRQIVIGGSFYGDYPEDCVHISQYGHNSTIIGLKVWNYNDSEDGFFSSGKHVSFSDCEARNCGGRGFYITGSHSTLDNIHSNNNDKEGILFGTGSDYSICSGSIIYDNSQDGAGTYGNINIYQPDNISIHDCIIYDNTATAQYGIKEGGTTDHNSIKDNIIYGSYTVGTIYKIGSNTEVRGNDGYETIFPTSNVTSFQTGFAWVSGNGLLVKMGSGWVNLTLDTDTTYSSGSGLNLSGTTFSLNGSIFGDNLAWDGTFVNATDTAGSYDPTLIWNSNGNNWTATVSNLQLATYDLNSTGGGWVHASVCNLSFTKPLKIPDNVELIGYGNKTIFHLADSTNRSVIENYDLINGNTGIRLSNFRVEGNGDGQYEEGSTWRALIYFEKVKDSKIENLYVNDSANLAIFCSNCDNINIVDNIVTNSGNCLKDTTPYNVRTVGIWIDNTNNTKIRGNTVRDSYSDGIVVETRNHPMQSSGWVVSDNICVRNYAGIWVESCENGTLSNNICCNNFNTSAYAAVAPQTFSGITLGNSVYNTSLSSNICNSNEGSGIHIAGGGDEDGYISINGGICNSNGINGIYTANLHTTITGVVINENAKKGIRTYARNITIDSNNLDNNGEEGIYIDWVSDPSASCIISDNEIVRSGLEGIECSMDNSVITGNNIRNGNHYGISVKGDNSIVGLNRIDEVLHDGIKFWTVENCTASLNIITDSDNANDGIEIANGHNMTIMINTIWGFADAVDETGTCSNNKIKDNIGYITENYGTCTVSNGNTYIVVNHGLDVTPSFVMVTANETLNNAAFFWVHTYTSTQFNLTVNADPGVDVDFKWWARLEP